MRTRTIAALSALLTLAIAIPAVALGPDDPIDGPAAATQQAVPASVPATDVISVYNSGELRSDVVAKAEAAARQSGAALALGRSASVGMIRLSRGSSVLQQPASGFAIPMGVTALSSDAIGATLGRDVSQHLAADAAIMGQTSANLRGARAGDTMLLISDSGAAVSVRISAVLPDAKVGGAELLMSLPAADRLGIHRLSRVLMWSPTSRSSMNTALSANNLIHTSIRVRRSWDAPDPDDTIGMAETKAMLGEFSYRINSNGWLTLDSAWMQNITYGAIGGLRLSTGCHKDVRPALAAAMNEISARGLSGTINFNHANTAGGCFGARFNRLTPSSSLGFLSRHSWGMAVDTNTVGSCQGCIPDFIYGRGCETVQVFRKHGFAWGGNYLTPDGMHFEYVGERRDQLPYPSRFCPNTGAVALTVQEAGTGDFFAGDGLEVGVGSHLGHDH